MPAAGRAQLKVYLHDHRVSFKLVEHARSEPAEAKARAAYLPAEQTAKPDCAGEMLVNRAHQVCQRCSISRVAEIIDIARPPQDVWRAIGTGEFGRRSRSLSRPERAV